MQVMEPSQMLAAAVKDECQMQEKVLHTTCPADLQVVARDLVAVPCCVY